MNRRKCIIAAVTGVFAALALIYVFLISTMEHICYSDMNYFREEYEKHQVLETLPRMSLDGDGSLMDVTVHMMKYLRGDEDTPELQVEAVMDGESRGFFTDREIAHMKDVRELFIKALTLRTVCVALALAMLLVSFLVLRRDKACFLTGTGKGILTGTGIFLIVAAAAGIYIVNDFSEAFIKFHLIFFDNDLWLLDPSVDMLVNIVPEGFFFDTVFITLKAFFAELALLIAAGILMIKAGKKIKA